MVEGLYTAAAGMAAQQIQLEAVSNDIANLSTTGYKAQRVAFSDLLYSPLDIAGTTTESGAGSSARLLGRSGTAGAVVQTGRSLDLAIEGDGYFVVKLPGGGQALTRNGAFTLDANGNLTDASGDVLAPGITLPAGVPASALRIATDGTVSAAGRTLGRIQVVAVAAPDRLLAGSGSLLTATEASGAVHAATGRIRQGALEQSNVNLGREMTQLMTTEHSFQLSSSAVQTESQMMSIANQLRP
jgi:flagellar basal-body rod protein FlgG